MTGNAQNMVGIGLEITFMLERTQTIADGGNAFHTPLEDSSHSSAIVNAARSIITMINTTKDKIRFTFFAELIKRQRLDV